MRVSVGICHRSVDGARRNPRVKSMRNDEAADVMIGVGIKPCVHFHFASEHALKLGRLPVPVGNFFRARGEFAVFRYNSKLLLSRERLFAQARRYMRSTTTTSPK